MKIKDTVLSDRPRERLYTSGKDNVSNEELISIILKSGIKDKSVKELSSFIMNKYSSVSNLRYVTVNELCKIKGIGKVKAITLMASIELGKRVYFVNYNDRVSLNSCDKVFEYFKSMFYDETQELFYAVYLDTKSKLISFKMLFKGTIDRTSVHPREVFKYAFLENACSIIVIHNHPSGDVSPSEADKYITEHLISTGQIIGIPVVDHIIIGSNSYYSFYNENNNK